MNSSANKTFCSIFAFAMAILVPLSAQGAIYPAYIDSSLTLGDAEADAPYPLEETFNLDSYPSASKSIYLDFTGFYSSGNYWGHSIDFPAYDFDGDSSTFSDAELIEIQQIFQNVAEDFAPFNVNVTTEYPGAGSLTNSGGSDITWGVRVVMTQATAGFGDGIGGNAGPTGFDDPLDNPVFVFNKGARKGGQTATHEAGHSFGLTHDGLDGFERHDGSGAGSTSWGPIMGSPFQATLSQWSDGNYTGADNFGDDLAALTSKGFGYRTDDYATSISSPHILDEEDGTIFEWGTIEQNTDLDFFQFTTAPGEVSIDVRPFAQDPNLDVAMVLYDSEGNQIMEVNPTVAIFAPLNITLEAGSYVISVDGDSGPHHFDDYGSMGFYTIDIELPVFADLNSDDVLDEQDWQIFIASAEADLSGLTALEAYEAGDLDGDGTNGVADFDLFKAAYIEANGIGGFNALFVSTPEPSSIALLLIALAIGPKRRRTPLNI